MSRAFACEGALMWNTSRLLPSILFSLFHCNLWHMQKCVSTSLRKNNFAQCNLEIWHEHLPSNVELATELFVLPMEQLILFIRRSETSNGLTLMPVFANAHIHSCVSFNYFIRFDCRWPFSAQFIPFLFTNFIPKTRKSYSFSSHLSSRVHEFVYVSILIHVNSSLFSYFVVCITRVNVMRCEAAFYCIENVIR